MAEQLSPIQEAAAFHGLATNLAVPPADRLAMALQALDLYEAEVERMREASQRPDGVNVVLTSDALERIRNGKRIRVDIPAEDDDARIGTIVMIKLDPGTK